MTPIISIVFGMSEKMNYWTIEPLILHDFRESFTKMSFWQWRNSHIAVGLLGFHTQHQRTKRRHPQFEQKGLKGVPSHQLGSDHPRTCKWLGSPPFIRHFRPFGGRKTLLRGLTITMVINHILIGMILRAHNSTYTWFIAPVTYLEGHV